MKTLFFVAVGLVLTAIYQTAGAEDAKPIIHMKANNVVIERMNRREVKEDGITGLWFSYMINHTTSPNRYSVVFCEKVRPFDAKSVLATIKAAMEQQKKLELKFQKVDDLNCIVDANLIIE